MCLFLPIVSIRIHAQEFTLGRAVEMALKNNPTVQAAGFFVDQQSALQKTAYDFGKTELFYEHEEFKSTRTGSKRIGVRQNIAFPTVFFAQSGLAGQNVNLARQSFALKRNEIVRDVKTAYERLKAETEKITIYEVQDTLYRNFLAAAETRYEAGESSLLEKLSAKSKYRAIQLQKQSALADVRAAELELKRLTGVQGKIAMPTGKLERMIYHSESDSLRKNPTIHAAKAEWDLAKSFNTLTKHQFLPDIVASYARQTVDGTKGFHSYEVGLSFPLLFFPQVGQKQAAGLQVKIAEKEFESAVRAAQTEYQSLSFNLARLENVLAYYDSTALVEAGQLQLVSQKAYKTGEIGYFEYLQNLSQALSVQIQYIEALAEYNKTVIQLDFISGRQ